MEYVIGVLAGLAWVAAAAFINLFITKKAIEKQDTKAALTANYLRLAIDLVALVLIFLCRKILPFSYEACLISAVLALSIGKLIFAFMLGRKIK